MRPRGDELIRSARWTLEHEVEPHVDDALALSYLRSVRAVLFQAEERSRVEWPLLAQERADLRALLAVLRSAAPPALADALDRAEAADREPEPDDLPSLADRVARIREAASVAVVELEQIPAELRQYLSRQIARDLACLPPSDGPRF